MPRKYIKIDQYEKQILSMREERRMYREIAENLGLKKEQSKKWFRRYRNSDEIQRLKMENEPLRDFLSLTERK